MTLLLMYFVLVFFLAWYPWNGWLLALGGVLYRSAVRR